LEADVLHQRLATVDGKNGRSDCLNLATLLCKNQCRTA
jgi:hypothetical protein